MAETLWVYWGVSSMENDICDGIIYYRWKKQLIVALRAIDGWWIFQPDLLYLN